MLRSCAAPRANRSPETRFAGIHSRELLQGQTFWPAWRRRNRFRTPSDPLLKAPPCNHSHSSLRISELEELRPPHPAQFLSMNNDLFQRAPYAHIGLSRARGRAPTERVLSFSYLRPAPPLDILDVVVLHDRD